MPRKSLTQRERFEILKRDGFTCQYCGRKPPEVTLHIDHIEPLAEGGADEETNYITACGPCNLAKGARPLMAVTPCEFCWGDGPGLFADVPINPEGGMGHRTVFVCNDCVRHAIWQHWYAAHPRYVRCCGCGRHQEAPADLEEENEHTPPVVMLGELVWTCAICTSDIEKFLRAQL